MGAAWFRAMLAHVRLVLTGSLVTLLVAGCAPARPPVSPHIADACDSARPGTDCDLAVVPGEPPVVSHCTKLRDGSLICDSPRVAQNGPSLPDLDRP